MQDSSYDPVDHARTTRQRAGESVKDAAKMPGLLLIGLGVVAMAICMGGFAIRQPGWGVVAAIVALLSVGAGLAWMNMEGRRIRNRERRWVDQHHDSG
jgi:hypothetical protein